MSLFDFIFKKDKESEKALHVQTVFKELNGYRPVFRSWGGKLYESELVRAAIDAKARHCMKLQATFSGAARQTLVNKMKHAPNEWQTWSQFFYRASAILDAKTTCFIVPVFDAGLTVTGYYTVVPDRCDIKEYKGEPWLIYHFLDGKEAAVELRLCAILTRFQMENDFFGEGNGPLHDTMDLIAYDRQGIKNAIEQTASYTLMGQVDNFTDSDDLKKERERFTRKNLQNEQKNQGILLFPNTYKNIKELKIDPYTIDPEEAKDIRDNVFRYFGVNDKVLMNSATNDELDAFFNGAVEPFAIQISEGLTKAMYSLKERTNGNKFTAAANRLQYMNASSKVQMAQQLLDRGVMSINEARALFNYPDVEGGDVRSIRGEYKNANDLVTTEGVEVITVEEEENAGED